MVLSMTNVMMVLCWWSLIQYMYNQTSILCSMKPLLKLVIALNQAVSVINIEIGIDWKSWHSVIWGIYFENCVFLVVFLHLKKYYLKDSSSSEESEKSSMSAIMKAPLDIFLAGLFRPPPAKPQIYNVLEYESLFC